MTLSELKNLPIVKLVPHRPPMLLIDRVVVANNEEFEVEITIRKDSLFCDGTKVGSWVGIEYMAQAVAAYAGMENVATDKPVKIGFLLGTRQYECSKPFFMVGSIIRVTVKKVLCDPNSLSVVECSLRIVGEEKSLVKSNLTVFQVDDPITYLAGRAA